MTSTILAYVFGRRKDEVFKKLKSLLQPFNITRYYTDDWGAFERHLDTAKHQVGKRNTQKHASINNRINNHKYSDHVGRVGQGHTITFTLIA